MHVMRFRDRRDAGRLLGSLLGHYADLPDLLVLALPRGGVPVACTVARALDAPLDVFLVRKLGLARRRSRWASPPDLGTRPSLTPADEICRTQDAAKA